MNHLIENWHFSKKKFNLLHVFFIRNFLCNVLASIDFMLYPSRRVFNLIIIIVVVYFTVSLSCFNFDLSVESKLVIYHHK